MKIVRTPEILAFIQRCYQHMHHDYKNDFLGMTVTKENENKRKRELKAAGFAEFADPAKAPSLFLSLEEWQKLLIMRMYAWIRSKIGIFIIEK